jgi:tetratricopeptide (TPR) repeat protein
MKTISNKVLTQITQGPEDKATELLLKIISQPKPEFQQLSPLGKQLMNIGRFALAGRIFARWAEMHPKNIMAWSNLGGCLARMNLLKQAKDVLLHAISIDPSYVGARVNICGVYQALGEHKLALESALAAVQADPKSYLAFNNLGTALKEMGFNDEAKHAFETSLMLSKDMFFPKFNLAKIEAESGNPELAIIHFEELLKEEMRNRGANIDMIKYALGFEYLKCGRISEGFAYYEKGFSEKIPSRIARHPHRKFYVPQWDGTELKAGQRIMVWREQGVGDEVMFGACLPLLEKTGAKIILEIDKRLITVFQRSFPDFEVREQKFSPNDGLIQTVQDYDFHISIGSLYKHFIKSIDDMGYLSSYIRPNSELVQKFAERLDNTGTKRKIGICWRSGTLATNRNSAYTHLVDWAGIFNMPDTVFVNLQYGDCEEELREAESLHNIKIHRWDDVDLKEDLESVFALMHNLDGFVSVGTAVVPFAGAVGLSGVAMLKKGWVLLGCEDKYPWFPGIKPVVIPSNGFVAQALPLAPAVLEEILYEQQPA